MASTMIHLAVAYRIQQPGGLLNQTIVNRGAYYLGAVAPDAVDLDGFASKQVRWAAHLREKTPKEWYVSAEHFFKKQQEAGYPDRELLLGYLVHILTDAAFDETIHDPIWVAAAKAARLAGETVDAKEEGWKECFRFDRSQMHAFWWSGIVKPAFANAKPQEIGTIPSELLERYQDHLLYLYEKELPKEQPRVITPEMVWLLGDYVETILKPML